MTYAYLVVANDEMYDVEPGWRLFAVDTLTGAAYEMVGGFSTLRLAIACRTGFLEQGRTPADSPCDFQRLSADAVVAGDTSEEPAPAPVSCSIKQDRPAVERNISFSVLLPLPSAIKARAAIALFDDFRAEAPDGYVGFDVATTAVPPGLVLGSDDGDVEQLIEFIKRCAVRFHLSGRFGFFWSSTCSDLRPGGYDGGAIVIDLANGEVSDEIRTDRWVAERVDLLPSPAVRSDGASHRLDVRPFTSAASHGFELVNPESGDVAAVVHDGADRGIGEAQGLAKIFATAPDMLVLLNEALAIQGGAFDRDEAVDAADLVDQVGRWRRKVKHALELTTPALPS